MRNIVSLVQRMHARGEHLPAHLTLEQQRRLLAGEHLGPAGWQKRRRPGPETPYPWATPGRTLTLVLSGYLPVSLNKWGRNRHARRVAVAECLEVLIANYPELLTRPPEARPNLKPFWRPTFKLTMWFPTNRERDPGNWDKAIKDALVRCGLIRGDSSKHIKLEPEEFNVDPVNPRSELTLTERGPA